MKNQLEILLKRNLRVIPNFPKKGIMFQDIFSLIEKPELLKKIINEISKIVKKEKITKIIGIDARGFIFGSIVSNNNNIPFVPIRKKGKLPYEVVSYRYDLEYGSAEVEIHVDAIQKGWNVLVHDDLLATGGTASASAELIKKLGGEVCGFAFVIELANLNGKNKLNEYTDNFISLVKY